MLGQLWHILTLWSIVSSVFVPTASSIAATQNEATPSEMSVMKFNLNNNDMKQIEEVVGNDTQASVLGRDDKSFKDASLRVAAEALTDDEITDIIKSISQPNEENITEDVNPKELKTSTPEDALNAELRNSVQGTGKNFYNMAFNPMADNVAKKYTDRDVLSTDSRQFSKKSWKKYFRKLKRKFLKAKRKLQRQTRIKKRIKKLEEEPTLESFLWRVYEVNQKLRLKKLKKKKSSFSWFLW